MTNNTPSIEERAVNELGKIERSIGGLSSSIQRMYDDWKNPVMTMAEQMGPQWKEQEERQRAQEQIGELKRQNKILTITVVVAVVGMVISAFVGGGRHYNQIAGYLGDPGSI